MGLWLRDWGQVGFRSREPGKPPGPAVLKPVAALLSLRLEGLTEGWRGLEREGGTYFSVFCWDSFETV